jgi:NhaP-type Na+/H+ or K+/H+ antiporter
MKSKIGWGVLILGAFLFLAGVVSVAGWWWTLPLLAKVYPLLLVTAFAHFGAGVAYSWAVGWTVAWSEKRKSLIRHAQMFFFLSAVFGLLASLLGSELGVCSPLTMGLVACYLGAMAMTFGAITIRTAAKLKLAT